MATHAPLPHDVGKSHSPFDDSSDDDLVGDLKRRSNESSPTTSVYDLNTLVAAEIANSAQPVKEYSFFNSPSHLDIFILAGARSAKDTKPENEAMYYVDNSMINPNKPDVTLRIGPGKDGKIVGVCRMRFGLWTYHIGLGDPDNEDIEWEDMKCHGAFKTRHWEFSMPVAEGSSKHTFTWKRTHDKMLGATSSLKNRKLIDEDTKEVVAVYLKNNLKGWKKMGKFVIFKDYGPKWELMVLITLLGLIERQRRKRRYAMTWPSSGGWGP